MAWTSNGDILTQSGIDEGVGNLYDSAPSATRNRTQHINFYSASLQGNQIRVDGEWDVQAETDQLSLNTDGVQAGLIDIYGTMRLNSEFTFNNTTILDPRIALRLSFNRFGFNPSGIIIVRSGGTLDLRSFVDFRTSYNGPGMIILIQEGGTLVSREGGLFLQGGDSENKQFRFNDNSNMDIKGITIGGLTLTESNVNKINSSGIRITRVSGIGHLIAGDITQTERATYEGMDFEGTNTEIQFNTFSAFALEQRNSPVPIDQFTIVRNNTSANNQRD